MIIIAELELRGKYLNLPDIGKTLIPEDGNLEIEDYLGEKLVFSKMGFSLPKTDEEIAAEQETTTTDVKESLKNLDLDALIEMAKSSELPEKEWLKYSQNEKNAKMLMINYLSKKING